MKWLSILCAAVSISALSIMFLNWSVNNDITESFLHTRVHQPSIKVIKSIDVEFKDKRIILDVRSTRELTCDELIKELGVSNLILNNNIFLPACTYITPTHIRIIYYESAPT